MDKITEKMLYEVDQGGDFPQMSATIGGWVELEWDAFVAQCRENGTGEPTAYAFKEFLVEKLN